MQYLITDANYIPILYKSFYITSHVLDSNPNTSTNTGSFRAARNAPREHILQIIERLITRLFALP